MYKSFLRPFLFVFDPEKVHHFTFSMMGILYNIGLGKLVKKKFIIKDKRLERKLFGITFPNPVGLAAGFDKNALRFKELSSCGFGFIEIGTVTPKTQDGNEKPRLYRLNKDQAIINRMGFNNDGVENIADRLRKNPSEGHSQHIIIGGNIGKNKSTPIEDAIIDYLISFETLFEFVDYFVVNVSSPNTPHLRKLQEKKPLTELLLTLQERNDEKSFRKPILLKIAPDLSDEQLMDIIEIIIETKIDGIIATNTTLERQDLTSKNQNQTGGLSGKPLKDRATEVIRFLAENSNHSIPIVGVGGIFTAEDALEKLDAGASLIQLYTGFIYEGPSLIKKINEAVLNREKAKGDG